MTINPITELVLDKFLQILVERDEHCNNCEFKHNTKERCFCYFSYNCLMSEDKYSFFKEKIKRKG